MPRAKHRVGGRFSGSGGRGIASADLPGTHAACCQTSHPAILSRTVPQFRAASRRRSHGAALTDAACADLERLARKGDPRVVRWALRKRLRLERNPDRRGTAVVDTPGRSRATGSLGLQRVGGRVGRRPIPKGRAAPFRRAAAAGILGRLRSGVTGARTAPSTSVERVYSVRSQACQPCMISPHPVPKTLIQDHSRPPSSIIKSQVSLRIRSLSLVAESRRGSSRCTRLWGSAVNRRHWRARPGPRLPTARRS
jgi:hypothetical protein